jgi:UDP-N-acetylmuramyl pentapeptide phosphotransferase/UDP-N-acetylglucosamine-1-phosphate transferase
MDNIILLNLARVLLAAGLPLIIAIRIIPTVNQIARSKGLLNTPGERTSHRYKTPNLGGISIFIAATISWLFFISGDLEIFKFVWLASVIIFFTGLKDDIVTISPRSKLLAQTMIAILLVWAGLQFTSAFILLGYNQFTPIGSIIFTFGFIIIIINAVNLIDGIDGLASAIGILILSCFGLFFFLNGDYDWTFYCAGMIGALLAFFQYNVFGLRNKTFMGDSGSLLLGLSIAVTTIKFWEAGSTTTLLPIFKATPAIALAVIIIPVFDTGRVFFYRIVHRTSPFTADRNHMHHRLIDCGLKHLQATSIMVGVNILIVGIAVGLSFFIGTLWITGIIVLLMLGFVTILNQRCKKKKLIDEKMGG